MDNKSDNKTKTVWGIILKVVVAMATALAGAFGISSCMGIV